MPYCNYNVIPLKNLITKRQWAFPVGLPELKELCICSESKA